MIGSRALSRRGHFGALGAVSAGRLRSCLGGDVSAPQASARVSAPDDLRRFARTRRLPPLTVIDWHRAVTVQLEVFTLRSGRHVRRCRGGPTAPAPCSSTGLPAPSTCLARTTTSWDADERDSRWAAGGETSAAGYADGGRPISSATPLQHGLFGGRLDRGPRAQLCPPPAHATQPVGFVRLPTAHRRGGERRWQTALWMLRRAREVRRGAGGAFGQGGQGLAATARSSSAACSQGASKARPRRGPGSPAWSGSSGRRAPQAVAFPGTATRRSSPVQGVTGEFCSWPAALGLTVFGLSAAGRPSASALDALGPDASRRARYSAGSL